MPLTFTWSKYSIEEQENSHAGTDVEYNYLCHCWIFTLNWIS